MNRVWRFHRCERRLCGTIEWTVIVKCSNSLCRPEFAHRLSHHVKAAHHAKAIHAALCSFEVLIKLFVPIETNASANADQPLSSDDLEKLFYKFNLAVLIPSFCTIKLIHQAGAISSLVPRDRRIAFFLGNPVFVLNPLFPLPFDQIPQTVRSEPTGNAHHAVVIAFVCIIVKHGKDFTDLPQTYER